MEFRTFKSRFLKQKRFLFQQKGGPFVQMSYIHMYSLSTVVYSVMWSEDYLCDSFIGRKTPAASTFRRFCKFHQAVAKSSSEPVPFLRPLINNSETFSWGYFYFCGGGDPLNHKLRAARQKDNGFLLFSLNSILHIHSAAGSDLVHSCKSTMTVPARKQGIKGKKKTQTNLSSSC